MCSRATSLTSWTSAADRSMLLGSRSRPAMLVFSRTSSTVTPGSTSRLYAVRSSSCGLTPRPTDRAPCGSKSSSSTRRPSSASAAPRLIVVVVLPDPALLVAQGDDAGRPVRVVVGRQGHRTSGDLRDRRDALSGRVTDLVCRLLHVWSCLSAAADDSTTRQHGVSGAGHPRRAAAQEGKVEHPERRLCTLGRALQASWVTQRARG